MVGILGAVGPGGFRPWERPKPLFHVIVMLPRSLMYVADAPPAVSWSASRTAGRSLVSDPDGASIYGLRISDSDEVGAVRTGADII